MITIAHVWLDYLPNTFVEPHPYLVKEGRYGSIILAANVYDNGSAADSCTYYYRKKPLTGLHAPSRTVRIINRILRPLNWHFSGRFISNKIQEKKPSLIHIHFGTTAANLLRVMKQNQIPTVVSFYGVDASAGFLDRRSLAKYRELFQLADRFIVLCETVKERFLVHGCPPEKVIVWNMPAGVEKFPYQERRTPKVADDAVRFITAARFVEKKGHVFLLHAFEKLIRQGKKATLSLIGYGPLLPLLETRIRELGLSGLVRIEDTNLKPNFADHYSELLKSHDIFVLPSTTARSGDDEGGPALTLVCAQAAGLPVICTPFPGSEITVSDGSSGLFCRENDADSLCERMMYLMERPELWNHMGARGHALAMDQFAERTQMEQMCEIYEDLLDEKETRRQ